MTNKMNGPIPESRSDHEPDGKASLTGSNFDNKTSTETSSQTTIQGTDATYASQLSLENPQGFTRDALGRQSMSEKRHATLDAKNTDTYQRSKKLREERNKNKEPNLVRVGSVESVISINRSSEHPEYADKLGQLGPSLGMKKSSSLESLQTMVQEIQMQEESDPAYSYRGPSGALKVIRGRGCEESFRAAVDKHIVDPNHRSEISAKKHWLLDPPMENEREIDGFNNIRGAPRQSSLNAALDSKSKSGKKKSGLFKGIGSMFRFGKHRKLDFPTAEHQHYHPHNEFDSNQNPQCNDGNANPEAGDNQSTHSDKTQDHQNGNTQQLSPSQPQHQGSHVAVNQQREDQQRDQPSREQQRDQHREQHADEQQQQRLEYQQREQHRRDHQREQQYFYQRHGFTRRHAEQVQVIPEHSIMPPVKFRGSGTSESQRRAERKLQEQQRLAQRHTYYQTDERDIYDQRQLLRLDPNSPYGEYGRPGSRSGITDSVPFTHYVNYVELQNHLSRKDPLSDSQIVQMRLQVQQQRLKVEEESRKQHQYHSQRQTRMETQLRPVSNFYEYESVQSLLNNKGPRTNVMQQQQQQQQQSQHHPQDHQDLNSNSLPRSQQPTPPRHPSGRSHQHRGPFVTHVTIGEHKQPNGTKV